MPKTESLRSVTSTRPAWESSNDVDGIEFTVTGDRQDMTRSGSVVGLTWHPNSSVLVEGPEIAIRPVGVQRLPAAIAQVNPAGGEVR